MRRREKEVRAESQKFFHKIDPGDVFEEIFKDKIRVNLLDFRAQNRSAFRREGTPLEMPLRNKVGLTDLPAS